MTRYDWTRLDEGWELTPNNNPESLGLLRRKDGWAIPIEVIESWDPEKHGSAISPNVRGFRSEAKAQLAKCCIRDTEPAPAIDNTPLFEAMDAMSAEIPKEEWAKVPSHGELMVALYSKPPWRRGHLAAWTLVNISNHDGRLTVIMKRGRGELIDETGPDDEHLWARLGEKARLFTPR